MIITNENKGMAKKLREETNIIYDEGYNQAIKDVLEYLSDRGFRESNYEITELTKWLSDRLQRRV